MFFSLEGYAQNLRGSGRHASCRRGNLRGGTRRWTRRVYLVAERDSGLHDVGGGVGRERVAASQRGGNARQTDSAAKVAHGFAGTRRARARENTSPPHRNLLRTLLRTLLRNLLRNLLQTLLQTLLRTLLRNLLRSLLRNLHTLRHLWTLCDLW